MESYNIQGKMYDNGGSEWVLRVAPLSKLRVTLFLFELFINILLIFYSFIFIYILYQTHTIHKNLKACFYNLAITAIIISSMRLIIIPEALFKFVNSNNFFYRCVAFIHDVGMTMDDICQWVVAMERSISAIHVKHYESITSCAFLIFLVLAPWLVSLCTMLLNHLGMLSTGFLHVLHLQTLLPLLLFALIIVRNKIKYYHKTGNLSERYQTVENWKLVPALYVFILISSIRNILKVICNLYIANQNSIQLRPAIKCRHVIRNPLNNFSSNLGQGFLNLILHKKLFSDSAYNIEVIANFMDLSVAIFALLMLILITITHWEMKRYFRRIFKFCFGCQNRVHQQQHQSVLLSVDGKELMTKCNASEHFRQLNLFWDVTAQKSI